MHVPLNDLKRAADRERDALEAAVARVIESGWYILGKEVQRFELSFADYCGVAHAVGVGNGTDALELALRALDVGPDAEVITVANAGVYVTTAVRRIGARPAYVDVLETSMNLDPRGLVAAVSTATAAVVVTHLYGRVADVDGIAAWCENHDLPLIEDCAQAHGARHGGRRAGSFGRIGCFSFYPTKNLGALGDGGAVVTDDGALAGRLRALRQYGWQAKYDARIAGGANSRLDEIQAAVLDYRLASLDASNNRRRDLARRYGERIRHPAIDVPPIAGEDDVAHLYVIRTRQRASLQRHLGALGIATDVHYPTPDHLQAAYPLSPRPTLSVTERLADEVLTLPCFPELSDVEADAVIRACNSWQPDA